MLNGRCDRRPATGDNIEQDPRDTPGGCLFTVKAMGSVAVVVQRRRRWRRACRDGAAEDILKALLRADFERLKRLLG